MKNIPNLFTLLNLFFGCLAIIFVLQNGITIVTDSNGSELINIPERIWMASLFIGLAAVVDFLDGFIARLFSATSEMGKQLDSLSDLVSFGVAPAMIIYQFLRLSFAQQEDGLDVSIIGLLPSLLLPCAAAWRLARFNLVSNQTVSFRGMPVPAAGILIASLPLIYWNVNQEWVIQLLLNKWFLYVLVLLVSFLMVSSIPMLSLKFKDFKMKNNLPQYILIGIAIVSIIVFKWIAIPVIMLAYVLVSLLFKNKIA